MNFFMDRICEGGGDPRTDAMVCLNPRQDVGIQGKTLVCSGMIFWGARKYAINESKEMIADKHGIHLRFSDAVVVSIELDGD